MLRIRFWADAEGLRALRDSLDRIEGPTRARRDCRHFGVYESTDDPRELILLSEWTSQDALETHIRSEDFRVVLAAMDASDPEPHFQIDTVEATEGFELVAAILDRGAT